MAVPLLALVAAVPLAWGWGLSWTDVGLAVFFYFLTGLGITVGFHRYFTHRAFKARRALRIGLAVAGQHGLPGPDHHWVADHRRHHAFTDREGDPHSPWRFGTTPAAVAKGFLHAHLGWLFDAGTRPTRPLRPRPAGRPATSAADRPAVPALVAGQPGRPGRARWADHLVVVGCG